MEDSQDDVDDLQAKPGDDVSTIPEDAFVIIDGIRVIPLNQVIVTLVAHRKYPCRGRPASFTNARPVTGDQWSLYYFRPELHWWNFCQREEN